MIRNTYSERLITMRYFRIIIIVMSIMLAVSAHAQSAGSPLEVGIHLRPGVTYLHRSQSLPAGLAYASGIHLSGGVTISLPVASKWQITTGLEMSRLGYEYRLSPAIVRTEPCIRESAAHFRMHPTYWSIPLLVQHTLSRKPDHNWFITAGVRMYQRIRKLTEVDNHQDLLFCKILIHTESLYQRQMVSVLGGVGYEYQLTDHWRLHLSLTGEYGLQPFLKDNQVFLMGHLTHGHMVSLLLQGGIRYVF